ncbi:MAG: monovalent cation/H+ antiporter complex subunit F [Thermoplasmata archaeon]
MNFLEGVSTILIFIALFASYRLFVGPSVYDRLISLNVVGVMVTIILIIQSIQSGMGLYLDIAISFIMLSFVGTIAFVKYIEGEDFR